MGVWLSLDGQKPKQPSAGEETWWLTGSGENGLQKPRIHLGPPLMLNKTPATGFFFARFGPVYTTSGAVSAIADLKQRNSKKATAFMERVKIAVDMLNCNVPEAERNAAF